VHRIHYRFGVVLGLILTAVAFALAAPEGDGARFVIVTLQAAVLVAAVIASRAHRWVIRLSVLAAILGVIGTGAAIFGTGQFGDSSAAVVALLYILLTPPAIASGLVKHFRQEGGVTLQTMFGVLCLYLMVGLMFGVAFVTVQELTGNDFFTQHHVERDSFLYFSYATLTTVGYGDLVAATNLGRSLAITEALFGQIYLVTVVALIVGNLRPASREGGGPIFGRAGGETPDGT
jgi:ion channel